MSESARPEGIPGSAVPGPWPVGVYAARLRERLRTMARVQVFGEVFGLRVRPTKVYFELRDAGGALPCSMWRQDFEALRLELGDGMQVVAAGGCDFYPGSQSSSPAFSFAVSDLRVAGEGDLLAELERLRRALAAEGLLEPQKLLTRPAVPRTIGVVTGEGGKARDDVIAGLRRRGWEGRVVWAFAPVQDRHAAPRITRALQDLAACPEVEVIVVARGGGSLADLFAFCDETLCRTVALLRVPVVASVGHHTDRTLIDDVAAVSCSTPTHAAEAAVPVDCAQARERLHALGARLERQASRAILERARTLARLSRAPAHHVERHRSQLHQRARELRAVTRRTLSDERQATNGRLAALTRQLHATEKVVEREVARAAVDLTTIGRTAESACARRRLDLERLERVVGAHEPQRTLERGYALVEGPDGEPILDAGTARAEPALVLRLHDGRVAVRPEPPDAPPSPEPASTADRLAPGDPPLPPERDLAFPGP